MAQALVRKSLTKTPPEETNHDRQSSPYGARDKFVPARSRRFENDGLLVDYDDDDTYVDQPMCKEAGKVSVPRWPS